MADAEQLFPGKVSFIEAEHQAATHGDFAIRAETNLEFEVKTIHTSATIERRRTGFSIAESSVSKIVRDLSKKATEGLVQLDSNGTVVCLLWCDIMGAAVAATVAEFEITPRDVFLGGARVIGARDEGGRDRWFGFRNDEQWEQGLEQLATTLPRLRAQSLPLGLPDVKWGGNSEEWVSIGRVVSIDGSKHMLD